MAPLGLCRASPASGPEPEPAFCAATWSRFCGRPSCLSGLYYTKNEDDDFEEKEEKEKMGRRGRGRHTKMLQLRQELAVKNF